MSSTYTPDNGFELMATGDQASTWGTTLNNNASLIDQSLDGVANIVLSGTTVTLNVTDGSLSNGRCRVILFTGSPSSSVSVTITPTNLNKVYWFCNLSSQSISVSNGTGSALTVPAGQNVPGFCDGSGNVKSLTQTTTSVATPLIVSEFTAFPTSNGAWIVAVFGTVGGSRIAVAWGSGTGTNGTVITLPTSSGVPFTGLAIAQAALANVSGGGNVESVSISVTGNVITATATGSTGTPTVNATWNAMCYLVNY